MVAMVVILWISEFYLFDIKYYERLVHVLSYFQQYKGTRGRMDDPNSSVT